jgi:predicted unusual protein kinase regulating ubiquinone biosynthesis (AarF/ABC1/UbiB family)
MDDENTMGKRLGRYGRVSGTAFGLAAKLAGEKYFGLNINRDEHAEELFAALGNLKGPLMKIGQILATIPEALPPEYATAFQNLQANAPSMGRGFVRRRMKTELGAGWQGTFETFDQKASAAASLGQVHKAVSHDGQVLACKLQYPDMVSAIAADLRQLKLILSLYGKYDSSVKTDAVHMELSARLYEELDYVREAKATKLYGHMLADETGVHVPDVIDDLSTDRLLTTTWLDGEKIMDYVEATQETRNTLAMNLFRAWYVPLYGYGIIHGDPHPGNYTVRDDLSLNLLDFGCIRVFPASFIGGVIDLYNALMKDDFDLAVHAYETWGFEGLTRDYVEALNVWARFLYGPVMEDKIRPIGEVTNGIYGRETAEAVHKRLREIARQAGGISVPREFVFMDRAALGLGSVFLHLKAQTNWYRVFNELITDFDSADMQARQDDVLARFELLGSDSINYD